MEEHVAEDGTTPAALFGWAGRELHAQSRREKRRGQDARHPVEAWNGDGAAWCLAMVGDLFLALAEDMERGDGAGDWAC